MRVYFDGGPLDGRTDDSSVLMFGRTETGITRYQWSPNSFTDHHGRDVRVWTYLGDPPGSWVAAIGQVYRDRNCRVGDRLIRIIAIRDSRVDVEVIQAPPGFNRGALRLKLNPNGRLNPQWRYVASQEGQ